MTFVLKCAFAIEPLVPVPPPDMTPMAMPTAPGVVSEDVPTDCEAWCPSPRVCASTELDGGSDGEKCLTPEQVAYDEGGYGCFAACDGGCTYTNDGWECVPSEPLFLAQTSGRVRAKPSTESRITATFEAGAGVLQLERAGEWVRTHEGWVHHSLLERRFVPPPSLTPEHRGLRGWVAGFDAERRVLYEVVDLGNTGAVASTQLALCATPLSGEAPPPCLRANADETVFDGKPMEDHLHYLWNQHGLAVQSRLRGTSIPRLEPVEEAQSDLTVTRTASGSVEHITHQGKRVWTARGDGRQTVAGIQRLDGGPLLIRMRAEEGEGCCAAETWAVVEPQSKR